MDSLSQLQPGQMLGNYRIVRKIGQGGMGEVYEAWESALHRHIAIKILRRESLTDPEMTERFRGEGRALARLKQENVVTLYTLGEWQGRIYMAMEYIDGVPLDHFMLSHACSLIDILSLVRQMLEGLAAAHEAGIIHRDLKPANVVIDRSIRAKLVDFGIARVHSDRAASTVQTTRDVVIGTVNYLAPEVTVGRPATEQSDIYSLGLVFYHMLTGNTPFVGRSNFETLEKIRTTALAFSPRLHFLISDEIKRVVVKMTTKAPAMRYANAREVLADLNMINLINLPEDIRESSASGFPVANYVEVRKRCESLSFDDAESRFVLAIAAGIQADSTGPISDEVTEKTDARPLLEISELALGDAVRRYQKAKSTMMLRRQAEQQIEFAARRGGPEPDLIQQLLTAVCAILIFGGGFYFYRAASAHFHRTDIRHQVGQQASALMHVFGWGTEEPLYVALPPPAPPPPQIADAAPTAMTPVPAPPAAPGAEPGSEVAPAPSVINTDDRKVASVPNGLKSYEVVRPRVHFSITYWDSTVSHIWKVTELRGAYNVWESQDGEWELRTQNPFLPAIQGHNKDQQWSNLIDGDPMGSLFPLQKGKTAIYKIQTGKEEARVEQTLTCTVGDEAKTQVSAGQFQTIRVDCEMSSGERVSYDYASSLGHWVRMTKNGVSYELSGYSM